MINIIWKSFKLGDLLNNKTGRDSSIAQKNLTKSFIKDGEFSVSIVTESTFNNGVGFFMRADDPVVEGNIVEKGLTYGTQFGNCNWHNYPYFIIGNVNYLSFASDKVYELCNDYVGQFFAKTINKIFKKSNLFGYGNKIDQTAFGREDILLPCLECSQEDSIWEEDGRFYTLAVDYIKQLMDEAKELREEKTIRLYEAERAKYEAERAKYEEGYLKEKAILVWKSFRLDSVFTFDSGNQLSSNKKALNVSSVKDETYKIALITQSEKNNGISGYLEEDEEILSKKMRKFLTYSMHFGLCFYHDYDFVLMDTHGSVFRLVAKENKLFELMNKCDLLNAFFAKQITKICRNGIYNYSWLPNSTRVGRETILLPCLECSQEDSIWEEDGKFYTLAVDYISYLYLLGRVNYNQKLIDNYTYQY